MVTPALVPTLDVNAEAVPDASIEVMLVVKLDTLLELELDESIDPLIPFAPALPPKPATGSNAGLLPG